MSNQEMQAKRSFRTTSGRFLALVHKMSSSLSLVAKLLAQVFNFTIHFIYATCFAFRLSILTMIVLLQTRILPSRAGNRMMQQCTVQLYQLVPDRESAHPMQQRSTIFSQCRDLHSRSVILQPQLGLQQHLCSAAIQEDPSLHMLATQHRQHGSQGTPSCCTPAANTDRHNRCCLLCSIGFMLG